MNPSNTRKGRISCTIKDHIIWKKKLSNENSNLEEIFLQCIPSLNFMEDKF